MKELWQSLTSETEEILLKRGKEMCKKKLVVCKIEKYFIKGEDKINPFDLENTFLHRGTLG
jgi:hypothetical protein